MAWGPRRQGCRYGWILTSALAYGITLFACCELMQRVFCWVHCTWWENVLNAVILIVILIIIGIPSPTHSFTLGLNPSFSANPPYPSLSFFSLRFHYMDFPYCLLYFWAYPSFLLFSFSVFTLFQLSVPCGRLSWLMSAFERTLK